MSTLNVKFDAQKLGVEITKLLSEENINRIAVEAGFVRRERKLNGFKFLDMLLFTHFNHKELSLSDLSDQLWERYEIVITKQAIDERFTEGAVIFLKAVLESTLKMSIHIDKKLDFTKYTKVRIKDSTSFQLPENMAVKYKGSGGSGSGVAIRIQFEYDLKSGEILDLNLFPFVVQDMTNAKDTIGNICDNELLIRDLGYIKIDYLRTIEEKGAFYINRLHSSTNAYEKKEGKFVKLDLVKLYKYMRKNTLARIVKGVYIGAKEKFKTRIIIELLPDKLYKERLRKAKKTAKKKGIQISDYYKTKIGLNVFITNTDIPSGQVRLLYTLRWQIELMFKIWKSIGEINKIKKMKIERFEAFLFAKLIWIVINWQIIMQIIIYFLNEKDVKISPYKLFKSLKNSLYDFRLALINGLESIILFIEKKAKISPINFKSDKKKYTITWSYGIIQLFKN